MAEENIRLLDATDQTQIIVALQEWINGLAVLDDRLYLEFQNNGFGYCVKSNGGAITDEDICGNFSAEVQFSIYFTTNAIPDSAGETFKPLNDLSAWFRANGAAGLEIGDRRTPDEITTLKAPSDLAGLDEQGNATFFAIYRLTYDEEKGA